MNQLRAYSPLCLREPQMVLFTGEDVPDGDSVGEEKDDGEVQDDGDNDNDIAGALCGIGLSANGRSWKQGQV